MKSTQMLLVLLLSMAALALSAALLTMYKPWQTKEAVPVQEIVFLVTSDTVQTVPAETAETLPPAESQAVTETTAAVTVTKTKSTTAAPATPQPVAADEPEAVLEVQFPLDLNAASAEELEAVPGIGAVLAERILAYRAEAGGFASCEELMNVQGIGAGIYARVEPYLYVNETAVQAVDMEEVLSSADGVEETAAETAEPPMLDINLASVEDFLLLPGVTPEAAEGIVRLREQIHYFQNPYELLYADAVTDALFLAIRDYLYVSEPLDMLTEPEMP